MVFLWRWPALFFSDSSNFWGFSLYFVLEMYSITIYSTAWAFWCFSSNIHLYPSYLSLSLYSYWKSRCSGSYISWFCFLLCLLMFRIFCASYFGTFLQPQNWISEFLSHQNLAFCLKKALNKLSENSFCHPQNLVVGRLNPVC